MKGIVGFAAALSFAAAGCGTCLSAGEKMTVEVHAGADLNDSKGSGAQHVKYRVWGLNDVAAFEALASQPEGAAGLADPAQDAARIGANFGLPFAPPNAGGWITPGTTQTLPPVVAKTDKQFAAIGIVVLFPQPKGAVLPLDCKEQDGYVEKKEGHEISFKIGATTVAPGR